MPNGAVKKDAKHGTPKLSFASDAASDCSSHTKQQRQKLRKANQKSADELLDELLAEQLQTEPNEQGAEVVSCKPAHIVHALAAGAAARNVPIDDDEGEPMASRTTEVAHAMPPHAAGATTTRPVSFSPLQDATGATYTPRLHEVAHSVEVQAPVPLLSDVQQLHVALPDMLAKALEKQLAPLVAHQHQQTQVLQDFETKQKEIVARLEKLEQERGQRAHASQNAPAALLSSSLSSSGVDTHMQSAASGAVAPQPHQRSSAPRSRSLRNSHSEPADRTQRRSASVPDARATRRLVIQGFPRKYSLDELKDITQSLLRLLEHTLVLSRALYASRCTIILASHEEAVRVQQSFKDDPRFDGANRLYANWVVSQSEAKKGWILRAARRALVSRNIENVKLCYRSASLWVGRETALYVSRKGNLEFTEHWPVAAESDKSDLRQAFGHADCG
eukprot:6479277-Amphidinium_carterae.2